MIHIREHDIHVNGSVLVFLQSPPLKGSTISVTFKGREGTALVAEVGRSVTGETYSVSLDIDWSSFERFPDGE